MTSPTPDKRQALALYQANRLPEAEAAFAAWCALHPEDAETWSLLGIVHGSQGQWDQAERCCRTAIAADPAFGEAHVNLGVVLEARGQLDAAVSSYKEALRLNPQAQIHVNIGITLTAQGKRREALSHFRAAVALNPGNTDAWQALGAALEVEGEFTEAEDSYRTVLEINPASDEARFNLGNVLLATQRFNDAQAHYLKTLQLNPRHAGAYNNLGLTQAALDQNASAEASYRNALKLNPSHAGAHKNLGLLLAQGGRQREAGEHFQRSLEQKPEQADVHLHLANLLAAGGHLPDAATQYRAALALAPDLRDAQVRLAGVLHVLGHVDEAIALYRALLKRNPDWAEAQMYLGLALTSHGRVDAAIDCYRTALRLKPDSAEATNYLGVALGHKGALDESVECFRAALRINPDYADAYNNLGAALDNQGDAQGALASHRRALALKPDFFDAHSSILFMLHFQPDHDPDAVAKEYQNWNRRHAEPLQAAIQPHANERAPERRLRIGYVSDDFREHATNYFFEPVLAAHDSAQVEIFCYDTNVHPDAVTERLKSHAHHWRTIVGMSDEQTAEAIRRDAIDILVDLKGHTGHHRLLVFAQKPTPLQVTWLGYPNTTGLATMDYWIADRHIADNAMTGQYHSEKLLRLPDFYMCFRPKPGAPEAGPPPALANGFVSFGSFNTPSKINAKVIAVWAEILKSVSGSRLLMAAVPEGKAQANLRERFAAAGIGADRLILKPRLTHAEFLRLHREADIALDSFPCNGTTTTLHDLWMGLPVIALAGTFHASRVGVSILTNLGLPELIAQTPEDYVRIARDLAADTARLSALRAGLRERLRASPLMDATRFTRNLEAAYREIWRDWCAQTVP